MIIVSDVGVVSSNVFYFNFLTALSPDTMQICVRHCPNDTLLTHTDIWDLHTNQNISIWPMCARLFWSSTHRMMNSSRSLMARRCTMPLEAPPIC